MPIKKKVGKQRLVFEKLAVPGSLGSGMATFRGTDSSSSGAAAATKKQKRDSSVNTTLDGFLKPKDANAARSCNGKQTTRKVASALLLLPVKEPDVKGKGKAVDAAATVGRRTQTLLVPDSETEDDDDLDFDLESLLVAPRSEQTSEVSLGSDKSDTSQAVEALLVLPRMPTPLPGQPDAVVPPPPHPVNDSTVFGFGDSGAYANATPAARPRQASKQRLRRVIETSSPVRASSPPLNPLSNRILASPSSVVSPVQSEHLSDVAEEEEDAIEPIASTRMLPAAVPASERRAGSRIPWDSSDEAERDRLNVSPPSASQIERDRLALRDLRVQRVGFRRSPLSPRKATLPTVQAQTTSYMDRWREESYSPVQYTWSESLANNVRGRLGLSPKKRIGEMLPTKTKKNRVEQEADKGSQWLPDLQEPAVHDGKEDDEEARAASPLFDESATEHSTFSQPVASQQRAAAALTKGKPAMAAPIAVPRTKVDDSGFVDLSAPSPSTAAEVVRLLLAPDSRPDGSEYEQEEAEGESIPSSQQQERDDAESETVFPETFVQPFCTASSRQYSNVLPVSGLLGYNAEAGAGAVNDKLTAQKPAVFAKKEEESVEDSQDECEGDDDDLAMELDDSLSPSAGRATDAESQAEIEDQLLRGDRRWKSRILASDTQEVLDVETQDVDAVETQYYDRHASGAPAFAALCPERAREALPCSRQGTQQQQEQSAILAPDPEGALLEAEIDERGSESFLPETVPAIPRGCVLAGKPRKSIEASISSAWFTEVLAKSANSFTGRDTIAQQQQQAALTDFFALKPGGPADRLAAEREREEASFLYVVQSQRRDQLRLHRQQVQEGPKKVSFAATTVGSKRQEDASRADTVDEDEVIADSDSDAEEQDFGQQVLDFTAAKSYPHPLAPATATAAFSKGEEEGEAEETQYVPSSQTQYVKPLRQEDHYRWKEEKEEDEAPQAETQFVADSDEEEDEGQVSRNLEADEFDVDQLL